MGRMRVKTSPLRGPESRMGNWLRAKLLDEFIPIPESGYHSLLIVNHLLMALLDIWSWSKCSQRHLFYVKRSLILVLDTWSCPKCPQTHLVHDRRLLIFALWNTKGYYWQYSLSIIIVPVRHVRTFMCQSCKQKIDINFVGYLNPGIFSKCECFDRTKYQGSFGMGQVCSWVFWTEPHFKDLLMWTKCFHKFFWTGPNVC